jgi:hypothetical protein
MSSSEHIEHEARIPADAIENFDEVLSAIKLVRKLPEELRPQAFEDLLSTTKFEGEKRTLLEETLSQVTRPENEEPTTIEKSYQKDSAIASTVVRRRAKKPEFRGLVVKVGEGGEIINAALQEVFAQQDEKDTRKMQRRVPSGPAHNTFHVSSNKIPPRKEGR